MASRGSSSDRVIRNVALVTCSGLPDFSEDDCLLFPSLLQRGELNYLPDWQPSKPCLFAQPLDRVPEKLSQHSHKKDGALNIARRFSQVEQLPQSQRKQIVQILDAFLEREKLKKAS